VRVREGLQLMLLGMVKKVAIADRLAVFVDPVYNEPYRHHGAAFIFATFMFGWQIFYDFSGYTDIARGAAKVLGFSLVENFDRPYFAQSITDFWRRWHISLSSWFREYVYFPLGGSRVTKLRWIGNILVVFLLTGLWHGAQWTFIIWGALHGIYRIIDQFFHLPTRLSRYFNNKGGVLLRVVGTYVLVNFAWIFFRAHTVQDALYVLSQIPLGLKEYFSHQIFMSPLAPVIGEQSLGEFLIVVGLIAVIEGRFIFNYSTVAVRKFQELPIGFRWAVYCCAIWIILLSGRLGEREFIYFTF
jgi:alginate O-acetyltransferase complex protein AlgI